MKDRSLFAILCTAPFLACLIGYFLTKIFLTSSIISIPNLVGMSAADALKEATQAHVSLKIAYEKEIAGIAQGSVLDQTPLPGSRARTGCTIFLTLAKKPDLAKAPDLLGKNLNECSSQCRQLKIALSDFSLYSKYPKGLCFAQSPLPGEPLNNNKEIIVYISAGILPFIIVPNLAALPLKKAEQHLLSSGIQAVCIDQEGKEINDMTGEQLVYEQNPRAGSIINANTSPTVQLLCKQAIINSNHAAQ